MPVVPLPERPSLTVLRAEARDLQRGVAAGALDALAEVAEHVPEAAATRLTAAAARLVVARRHEHASWADLSRYVEAARRYSRYPARLAQASQAEEGGRDDAALADAFLALACLTYEDNGPPQWREAGRLLRDHPGLTGASACAAAAAADTGALAALLAADPAAASREGGPYQWEPLCYLAYARHDPGISRDAVLAAAGMLLDAGADPDAGYLWHGLCTPFTVLTGVFGEGEAGPALMPRHPHWQALARLLLEAGADPSDGQALYNRMFEPGTEHLELLLEFGLGTGDGGPWRRRLGDLLGRPADEVRGQLGWAVAHGMTDRVRLLAEHGADITSPGDDGVTPAEFAATTGHPDIVSYLVSQGAPAPRLAPADAWIAAALAADADEAVRLAQAHPGVAEEARAARPSLIVWAAAHGRPGSVAILAAAGWDVNVMGRTDVPSDMPWQTALHAAAQAGDLAAALLGLGADPGARDYRFSGTPLSWARHFSQDELIALLEPVTPPGEAA
jgi:hypothetical protein